MKLADEILRVLKKKKKNYSNIKTVRLCKMFNQLRNVESWPYNKMFKSPTTRGMAEYGDSIGEERFPVLSIQYFYHI